MFRDRDGRSPVMAAGFETADASRGPSRHDSRTTARHVELVAFGDSLTAGYAIGSSAAFPAVLQQYLDRERLPCRVFNAGVSGDTSGSALPRLPAVIARKPAIVVLALGANDGLRGVPVATMRQNLSRAIAECKGAGARVILCGMEALPLYGWPYTTEFHNAFVHLANEYRVPLVPFFMATVLGRPDLLLDDGLHPNASGARAIADVVWPHVEKAVRELVGLA